MIDFAGGQYRQNGKVRLRCTNYLAKHFKCSGGLKFEDMKVSARKNKAYLGKLLEVYPHDRLWVLFVVHLFSIDFYADLWLKSIWIQSLLVASSNLSPFPLLLRSGAIFSARTQHCKSWSDRFHKATQSEMAAQSLESQAPIRWTVRWDQTKVWTEIEPWAAAQVNCRWMMDCRWKSWKSDSRSTKIVLLRTVSFSWACHRTL